MHVLEPGNQETAAGVDDNRRVARRRRGIRDRDHAAVVDQYRPRRRARSVARVDNVFDTATIGSVIVNEANGRYFEPAPGRRWQAGLTATW